MGNVLFHSDGCMVTVNTMARDGHVSLILITLALKRIRGRMKEKEEEEEEEEEEKKVMMMMMMTTKKKSS